MNSYALILSILRILRIWNLQILYNLNLWTSKHLNFQIKKLKYSQTFNFQIVDNFNPQGFKILTFQTFELGILKFSNLNTFLLNF